MDWLQNKYAINVLSNSTDPQNLTCQISLIELKQDKRDYYLSHLVWSQAMRRLVNARVSPNSNAPP